MNNLHIDEPERIAFDEEARCLDQVEQTLDAMMGEHLDKASECEKQLSGWHSTDYDDAIWRKSLMSDKSRQEAEAEKIASCKDDPYFCRFEVSVNGGEPQSYCVGYNPIWNHGELVVLSWRSPLGGTYANKTQRQFKVESPYGGCEHVYDLHLRRRVDIKDAKLLSVNTEYDDASEVSLNGEIIDPFLLSVLRDKRRNYRLSDIIKTIQESQNDIMRRPIDESFIVQGCAGSGKTMILLHRLSYLVFNYPKVDFSKYLVLTPSESFNNHIDQLCDELDIGGVSRLTVEAYYDNVISQLSRADTYYGPAFKNGKAKATSKLALPLGPIVPDRSLDERYLADIYSGEFLDAMADGFMDLADSTYEELASSGALDLFERKGFQKIDFEAAPYSVYTGLSIRCDKVRRAANEAMVAVDAKKTQLQNAIEERDRAAESYRDAVSKLGSLKAAVMPLYGKRLQDCLSDLESGEKAKLRLQEVLDANAKRQEALGGEKVFFLEELTSVRSDLESAQAAEALLADDASFAENPAVLKRVDEACEQEAAEVARLSAEYSKMGVFNLGKRRRMKDALEQANGRLEEVRAKALDRIRQESVKEAEALREGKIRELEKKAVLFESRISRIDSQLRQLEGERIASAEKLEELLPTLDDRAAFVRVVQPLVAEFSKKPYPVFPKSVDVEEVRAVAPAIAHYIEAQRKLASSQMRDLEAGEERLRSLDKRVEKAQDELDEASLHAVPLEDTRALLVAERLRDGFDVRVFNQMVEGMLDNVAGKYGVARNKTVRYRHDAYAKAAMCLFYYGPPEQTGACVCVDEAQDLSPAEHSLIRGSLGSDVTVNLYGDLNQSVYDYKGISSWDELDDGGFAHVYVLKENYRNTLQVTDFCNSNLNMDVTGVGLVGPQVERVSFENAACKLLALLDEHEGVRCAIVISRKAERCLRQAVANMADDEAARVADALSWGTVDAGKIAVLPAELAKGLEFDAVAAVENSMSANERYVAYTRAVEALMVCEIADRETMQESEHDISDDLELEILEEMLESDAPVEVEGEKPQKSTESFIADEGLLSASAAAIGACSSDPVGEGLLPHPTLGYRGSAKCIRCEKKLKGIAYAGLVPTSGDKTRYLCAHCHDTIVAVEEARKDVSGVETAGSTYSITLIPEVDNERVRFALLDKKTGGWYLTGEGEYTSPTFRNMKWHRKFAKLAEFCSRGAMHVVEGDYDGNVIGEANFQWSTSEEFAQFSTGKLKKAIREKQ